MEDSEIIGLYHSRSEDALSETAQKYGGYCRSIAWNILGNVLDTEETLNDTWLAAWNSIPPQKPPKNRAASTQNTLPRWKAVFSVPTGMSILQYAKPI